jgi:uncharacterized damage-inducible protein DinB
MKLADIFTNYARVRRELIEAIEGLTPQQLSWTTPDYPNSIGHLVAHIAEAEYWWIEVVAEGRAEQAKAETDRFEQIVDRAQLIEWLRYYGDETVDYLRREELGDWTDVTYTVEWRKEEITKRDLVWHVVEHQARHRGQIFMLMRMQGLEVPRV